ncbi:MAG: hypothetical protein QG622_3202 [Actinomycetota bacterium]|nr:hypothetical protein [Actinomycetota bacterium]
MTRDRIWLDVTFADKDDAKAAGARWDLQVRRWYAPHAGMTALDRWVARPPLPDLLPGEDRSFGAGLFVDLVPESCWFTNARSCISSRDWERVRRMIVGRAEARCEVCGAERDASVQRWLEVHERWAFDEATMTQSLRRLICLCSDCHRSTHFGLATVRGTSAQARAHLRDVTGMSHSEVESHIASAFTVWRRRSLYAWHLDLTSLTDAGIELSLPDAASRPEASASGLRSSSR